MITLAVVFLQFLNTSCKEKINSNQYHSTLDQINGSISKLNFKSVKKYGIDVSHYNGSIVDEITKKDSLSFVICKATQGLNYVDLKFAYNWAELSEKGLKKGAYHFYVDHVDPVAQAEHYLRNVGELNQDNFGPIVDVERGSITLNTKNNINSFQNNLLEYLATVEMKTKRTPMIYTNLDFANKYLDNIKFADYHLWLAEYTTDTHPKLPEIWKNIGYKIWQRSDSYFIKSIKVDLNIADY